jgi:RND superfamily putative drug exporter
VKSLLSRLGHWVCHHRRAVICAWIAIVIVAALAAGRLATALLAGSGSIAGSQSERVEKILQDEFANPFSRSLLLALSSARYTVEDIEYQEWIEQAAQRLHELPEVERVATYSGTCDFRLRSGDGHHTVLIIGLRAKSFEQEERTVPVVRAALAGIKVQMLREDPAARFAVTGHAALTFDINDFNKRDGNRAEARALPVVLVIIVLAFGALIAAGIPLATGLASTTVASALALTVASLMPVSNLLQNIVTMVGLGLGIDYSLLMVNRFREARRSRPADESVAAVMNEAGSAVVYSGLAVMIGLCGLLFTPLVETRSVGIGGLLVVVVSMLATLTLVPAILAAVGERIDYPIWMSRPLRNVRAEAMWERTAHWVMSHPWCALAMASPLLGVLAWTALRAENGFTSSMDWYPRQMESRVGGEILSQMGNSNAILPIHVVVRSKDTAPVLAPQHLPALMKFADRVGADSRVGAVMSAVTLRRNLGPADYTALYRDIDFALIAYPEVGPLYLSRDRSTTLLQVIPADRLPLRDAEQLARELSHTRLPLLDVAVGGTPVYYNDFNDRMRESFPRVFAFVIGASLLVLGLAFRSFLIPLKAVVANLLAVAAGYGAVVAVFQLGWLNAVPGLEQPLSAIPLTIPLLIFCITFGLSMDYEIFLLCRIKQAYDASGDNSEATATGVATTAGIITSAALIMVTVFGAALSADIAIIRMLGLGLAVTVAVDATLIRILIVPAVMALAGHWNWYPGAPKSLSVCAGQTLKEVLTKRG